MKTRMLAPPLGASAILALAIGAPATGQTNALPPPHFHHIQINSVDPDTSIEYLAAQFPDSRKTTWGGMPALKAPTNTLILYNKVLAPAPSNPQETAIWHFGWHVTDIRKKVDFYRGHPEVDVQPMYTDDNKVIYINSDTIPGTKAEIDAARAKGQKPAGGAGVAYISGPDNILVENVGNNPVERFNHVHMYQEDPYCAQLWYRKHLNATVAPALVQTPPRTEANCKVPRGEKSFPALIRGGMYRAPNSGVMFDDVAINWPVTQLDKPLQPTRGHVVDHIGLSVANLDAWAAKLKSEGVKFLEEPHRLGDTRAFMIEGPSREAIEIVEVK